MLKCTNGHDKCYLGPDENCPYCENDTMSVEEIIAEWRSLLDNERDTSPIAKHTAHLVIPREQIESMVRYFDDIDDAAVIYHLKSPPRE